MPDERVLRWIKGSLVYCPTCNAQVIGYSVVPEEFWTLKPEYAGISGLPVGPQFGERHVARMHITLQPCGHQVDKLEITTPPKPPDPFEQIELTGMYSMSAECKRCGQSVEGLDYTDMSLKAMVTAANTHLKTCQPKEEQ